MSSEKKIELIQQQVEETKDEIHKTLHQLADREKKLDELKAQTEMLSESADRFKPVATGVHRKMWWKNAKMTVILTIVIILILAAIIVPIVLKVQGKLD